MTTIHAQLVGDRVLLPRNELEDLLDLARKTAAVDVHISEEDIPTFALMRLADQGGAFDFWHEDGENVHSAQDGEPI